MTIQQPAHIIEATARALLEFAPDAVVVVDADGRILLVNEQTEQLFGYQRDELLGAPVELLLPERLRQDHVGRRTEYVDAPRRRPMGAAVDLWARRKDGSEFQVEISLSPVEMDGNTVVTSIIRDVTERKRAEEELRRWAEFFDRTEQGLAIITPDGRRRAAVNPAYARIHGYTVEELTGSLVGNMTHPDHHAGLREHIRRADDEGHHLFETVHVRKDGSSFPVMVDLTSIKDDHGQLLYRIMHVLDITELKLVQEHLKEAAEELARSNAELQQFAYVASHDLQEPLRMVASYTQLLARRYRGKLDADADEFIGYAVDGAQRMQTLINDLLEYSRVGTRGGELRPTSCDELLNQVVTDLAPSIAESQAEITWDPLPTIRADPTQIRRLFQNLLSNAIKFRGEEPPKVHVSARPHTGQWLFSIADNGIGIDPQYADRVFTIFQRLHSRQEYPGTGIGLAICRKIVERHGGRIWVEDNAGPGTTFHFTIPRSRKGDS